jgi:hypothetical protein
VENFEISPLRFSYEAILSEYRALRDEISARIQKQQEMTSFAIAIVGGFVALAQLADNAGKSLGVLSDPRYIIPISSLIFSSFTLMIFEHEMNIAHLQNYIDLYLKPRLNEILARAGGVTYRVLEWNQVRSGWQQHHGWLAVLSSSLSGAKYVMTMLPSLVLSVAFWFVESRPPTAVQVIAYAVSAIAFMWVLVVALYTSSLYVKMDRDRKTA